MPTTQEVTLYTFSELPEDAQQKVIDAERERRQTEDYFPWGDEISDSFRAFAGAFNLKWSQDSRAYTLWDNIDVRYDGERDEVGELSGVRLATYLRNNFDHVLTEPKCYPNSWTPKHRKSRVLFVETCCPLTGVCYDESLLRPIRAFLKNPMAYRGDFNDLMGDCVSAWAKDCQSEYDYYLSDESIREAITNGYGGFSGDEKYTKDGELWPY